MREWLLGLVCACLIAFLGRIVLDLDPEVAFGSAQVTGALRFTILWFLPGAALGSAVGVPFARAFGWRRQWLSATVLGVAFGALTTLIASLFSAILGT